MVGPSVYSARPATGELSQVPIPPGPVITEKPILPVANARTSSAPLKAASCRAAILYLAIQSSQKAQASSDASESSNPFLPVESIRLPPSWVTNSQILCQGSKPSAGAIAVPHWSVPLVISLAAAMKSLQVVGTWLMPAAWNMALLWTIAQGLPLTGTAISLSGDGPLIVSCGGQNSVFAPPAPPTSSPDTPPALARYAGRRDTGADAVTAAPARPPRP